MMRRLLRLRPGVDLYGGYSGNGQQANTIAISAPSHNGALAETSTLLSDTTLLWATAYIITKQSDRRSGSVKFSGTNVNMK
jgi:hypothetical protein